MMVSLLSECFDQPAILSELRYRTLSWLGHAGQIIGDRLPNKLLFCQVKGNILVMIAQIAKDLQSDSDHINVHDLLLR
jgi:hypothetical protein